MTRLGLSFACGPAAALRFAIEAEAAGFDDAWTTEFSHRSSVAPMAAIGAATSTIGVGSAITYAFGRSPLVLAAETRDIDDLAGGRLVLGLGTAQPRRMAEWLGVDPARPAARMRELVDVLRALWRLHEGAVHHDGHFYSVHVEPAGDLDPPTRADVPVYVAGINTGMVRVAGAVGDGLIGHPIVNASAFDALIGPPLHAAAADAARRAPRVLAMVITVVGDDRDRVRREAAAQIAFYAQHRTYASLMDFYGFAPQAVEIACAAAAGSWEGMVEAVDDRMIDELAVAGPPDEVRERVLDVAGRYDHVVLHTPSTLHTRPPGAGIGTGRYEENVAALIETFAGHPTTFPGRLRRHERRSDDRPQEDEEVLT